MVDYANQGGVNECGRSKIMKCLVSVNVGQINVSIDGDPLD